MLFKYQTYLKLLIYSNLLKTSYMYIQESSCEQAILRDINRTFPANDFFKESPDGDRSPGQEALYKICKSYSIYDAEVRLVGD